MNENARTPWNSWCLAILPLVLGGCCLPICCDNQGPTLLIQNEPNLIGEGVIVIPFADEGRPPDYGPNDSPWWSIDESTNTATLAMGKGWDWVLVAGTYFGSLDPARDHFFTIDNWGNSSTTDRTVQGFADSVDPANQVFSGVAQASPVPATTNQAVLKTVDLMTGAGIFRVIVDVDGPDEQVHFLLGTA